MVRRTASDSASYETSLETFGTDPIVTGMLEIAPEPTKINGTDGIDTLFGTTGRDEIRGFAGNDYLYGLAGNDVLDGGPGWDVMAGGTGNDTYYVDDPSDIIWEWGGEGIDTVMASVDLYRGADGLAGVESYRLPEGVENLVLVEGQFVNSSRIGHGNDLDNVITGSPVRDQLVGFAGHDTLFGEYGDDTLCGDGGDDLLSGGYGRDYLTGGLGRDTLSGGPDRDVFGFSDGDTGATLATMDVITDFAPGDVIYIEGIDADVYTPGDQAFRLIGQAAFSGTPGEINFVHINGNTVVQFQTGTSPDVDAGIVLTGVHFPEASWFAEWLRTIGEF